jgi:hypothetical protein
MKKSNLRCAFGFALLWGGAATAGDRVAIKIINDNTADVIVTVRDLNAVPPSKVVSHQRINGFASIPVAVTAAADGTGHVVWHAVTADPQFHKCGRKDRPGLRSQTAVHVYAKADCPPR